MMMKYMYTRTPQNLPLERMAVPPPPEPKKNNTSAEIKKPEKELPKPPAIIRNFDLVANLPDRTEESEDEYETFDGDIIEQPQRKEITRADSKLSLHSGRQGSVESVYKPPSATSHEEEEEEYEIYECITEMVSSFFSFYRQLLYTRETCPSGYYP